MRWIFEILFLAIIVIALVFLLLKSRHDRCVPWLYRGALAFIVGVWLGFGCVNPSHDNNVLAGCGLLLVCIGIGCFVKCFWELEVEDDKSKNEHNKEE